ncbi:Lrp/AsnC family transcriptional regulator [Roseomonas sp. GC11]|uniref:Lrp/AsnC family transcriptional regulator n=1 Tax=Roseomonas sp. GC11 TaxID=2950546 RepID=UPI00210CD61A|nr:Lrp/AsnC family transcriptional regulator [Roseomonas sp. GC11]MCQ4159984.1 Lrp/AsnC family transcriptional regulator [Roseomonas sp. GC11]
MDTLDSAILRLIQSDNRQSAADLGQAVGLSVSAAGERVRRLNAAGVVRANRAVVEPRAVGLGLCAFLFIDLEPRCDEVAFAAAVAALPEVQEAHHITGPHSWLLKLRVADTAALQALLVGRIKALPGVMRSETLVVLDTAKETTELALPPAPQGDAVR